MEVLQNENTIKYEFIDTGLEIIATLFTEFISPQTTGEMFSKEDIKHHLFHFAFRYDKVNNKCHVSKCEQRHFLKSLDVDEFKKIYEWIDCKSCLCSKSCINNWSTRENVDLEELDFYTFKRLLNCPTFSEKANFSDLNALSEKIICFRNAVSHKKSSAKITISYLLDAANAIKDGTKKGKIIEEIEKRLKDHKITSPTEIRIGIQNEYGRKEFLEALLGELHVNKKKKELFAKRNLRFYFKSSLTTEKDIGLLKSIEEKEKILDISERNMLLHTLCHFGLVNILKKMLDDPDLGLANLINNTDYRSQNCLMSACEQEEWDIAKVLLERYGDCFNLHQTNSDGKTALSLSVNNKEIVGLFVDKHLKTEDISISKTITGIAFSLVYHSTIPTLIKYLNNMEWTEHCFNLKEGTYSLYLKCNHDIDLKSLVDIEPNFEDCLGKNANEESVVGIHNFTFKNYRGLQIHKELEPTMFCFCDVDVEYMQEYVLRNITEDGFQDIIGTIELKDGHTGIAFHPPKDIFALERFGVIKRPIKRQYMLRPELDNYVVFDCGGHVYFPQNSVDQPEMVFIWEQRPVSKPDSQIEAGTDMIFIDSDRPLKLNCKAKFTFLGKFPTKLDTKIIKISNIRSGEREIKIIDHIFSQGIQTDHLNFSVKELCGKCVIFCKSEGLNHELLKKEIQLMYLNYKQCTAWFGIENITNGTSTAWVVFLFNNENFGEFLERNNIHLFMLKKKEDLIIRDFCTFTFQCIGSFKCDKEQFLHVQFCCKTNFVTFEIMIMDSTMDGGIKAEGLPDVNTFQIDFSLIDNLIVETVTPPIKGEEPDEIATLPMKKEDPIGAETLPRKTKQMAKAMVERLFVAAIDFGTTHSGCAFAHRDELEILNDASKVHSLFFEKNEYVSVKTPTCVLFDQSKSLDSFGLKAEEKYSDLCDEDLQHDWMFFERFKMQIFDNKMPKKEYLITDITGKHEMPAKVIFSHVISYIIHHFMKTIEEKFFPITENDITWVLTVPAIWSNIGKQFMREAAENAGIRSNQLIIALELEAAALYCKTLTVEKEYGAEKLSKLDPTTKHMVLDLSGGAADFTIQQVLPNGNLKVHIASRRPWGGTKVDEAFQTLLSRIFTDKVFNKFCTEFAGERLKLFREFETKKRTIKEKYPINLGLPWELLKKCEKSDLNGKLKFTADKLQVYPDVIIELFAKTVDNIVKHIEELFEHETCEGVNTIIMVGGFSDCKIIQNAIKKHFFKKQIIILKDAGLAIVKGAVLFGFNSKTISRKSQFTYGIEICRNFRTDDPKEIMITVDGEKKCKQVFDIHVGIDETVTDGEPLEPILYFPLFKNQESINFKVYRSTKKEPKYTSEDFCEYVGEVRLNLAKNSTKQSEIVCRMTFGCTEITIEAVEKATGQKIIFPMSTCK